MPGDLRDPEQSIPHHYDPRYDEAPNPFEPGAPDVDGYLQSIAVEVFLNRLSPEMLNALKAQLDEKGMFHRNMGDQSFRDEATRIIKKMAMARKVAHKWLT
jgi:hypothetical protein